MDSANNLKYIFSSCNYAIHLKYGPQILQGLNGPPHSIVVVQVLPQMLSDGVVVVGIVVFVVSMVVVVGEVGAVVLGVVVGIVVGVVVDKVVGVVVGIVVGVVVGVVVGIVVGVVVGVVVGIVVGVVVGVVVVVGVSKQVPGGAVSNLTQLFELGSKTLKRWQRYMYF